MGVCCSFHTFQGKGAWKTIEEAGLGAPFYINAGKTPSSPLLFPIPPYQATIPLLDPPRSPYIRHRRLGENILMVKLTDHDVVHAFHATALKAEATCNEWQGWVLPGTPHFTTDHLSLIHWATISRSCLFRLDIVLTVEELAHWLGRIGIYGQEARLSGGLTNVLMRNAMESNAGAMTRCFAVFALLRS